MPDSGGAWITLNGAHIFIQDGQSPADAIAHIGGVKVTAARSSPQSGQLVAAPWREVKRDSAGTVLTSKTAQIQVVGKGGKPDSYTLQAHAGGRADAPNKFAARVTTRDAYSEIHKSESTGHATLKEAQGKAHEMMKEHLEKMKGASQYSINRARETSGSKHDNAEIKSVTML